MNSTTYPGSQPVSALLEQIGKALLNVEAADLNDNQQTQLSAIKVLLNELLLRQQPDFYLQHLTSGFELLNEASMLIGKAGPAAKPPVTLSADLSADALDRQRLALYAQLSERVSELDEARSPDEKQYLQKLCAWESGFYQHRLTPVDYSTNTPALSAASLQDYLRNKYPEWTDLSLQHFSPLSGGFSKQTVLFKTSDSVNGEQSLVMRAEQPCNLLHYAGSEVSREIYMIRLMQKAGLPVAEPLWLESDASKLGMRFLVSRQAAGKTVGGNFGSVQRLSDTQLASMMETLFALHQVPVDGSDPLAQASHLQEWLPHKTITDCNRYLVEQFIPSIIAATGIAPSPQIQRGLNWLQRHVPQVDEPPVIVHLDYAFNNLIFADQQISAVLDWESSRLGDPADDIIWTQQSLQDYVSMPEFLQQYQQAVGREISAFRLAYARVAKCAVNAVCCLHGVHLLETEPAAHAALSPLAFQYMALVGSQFNDLIDAAEALR